MMMMQWEFAIPLSFWILGFAASRILKRNDIADVLWAPAIAGIGIWAAMVWPAISMRGAISLCMVCVWALRLSTHLLARGFIRRGAKTEDPRYREWRLTWGRQEPWRAFFQVFGLQAMLLIVVALPLPVLIRATPSSLNAWDFMGVGVFILGWLIEASADGQLFHFKKSTSGARTGVLDSGLFGRSRHPNYFGEILVWWGFGFLVIAADEGHWALASPILMTWLMARVSGVPLLERHLAQSKGAPYQKYLRETRALIPFSISDFVQLATVFILLIALDAVWLNGIMGEFYRSEGAGVLRLVRHPESGGVTWDPILWSTLGVYILLALAIKVWGIRKTWPETLLHGGLLGFCIYGIYDLTNLALVRDWSIRMAMVDWMWGTALCGLSALVAGWEVTRKS